TFYPNSSKTSCRHCAPGSSCLESRCKSGANSSPASPPIGYKKGSRQYNSLKRFLPSSVGAGEEKRKSRRRAARTQKGFRERSTRQGNGLRKVEARNRLFA